MMLHNKVREMECGQILEIRASDPSTQRDIPKFCQFLGHELLSQSQQDAGYIYLIKIG